jgi:hypothetical protein
MLNVESIYYWWMMVIPIVERMFFIGVHNGTKKNSWQKTTHYGRGMRATLSE